MNPLRIAVVAACPFPLARGTPIRILRMAEALAARGHEVHVATYHLGSGPVAADVRVHRIDAIRSYRRLSPGPTYWKLLRVDPPLARLLRRLLIDHSFDVIHAHHYEGLLVGAAARRGMRVPLVYDAHTLLMSELPYYRLGLPMAAKRGLGRWFDGWMPGLAEHTVCVTDTIRDKLVGAAGMEPGRVSVIANGVEVDHFGADASRTKASRAGRLLIFTGNLAEYQGIDLLLRAFAEVAPRYDDLRLRIASDSSFRPYEALAQELRIRERVELVPAPPFSALPQMLAEADLAANPRVDCDGVPVKLLNYMAASLPVVSFDTSAPGVVHGTTGWLAESGNIKAFAEGIAALLDDPVRAGTIGRAAREYIVRNCSWSTAAEHCEELYRPLCARPR
jgi:glycosyltransferase involved in cell wall biosynthesis